MSIKIWILSGCLHYISPLRRSSVTLDAIRPLLVQGRHSQKLELILVMVGEKHERCVIPRTEVRRLCKKHRALKAKINHVVRRLRELNATLLEALPVDNTEWAIVNGEFDILQEGAQELPPESSMPCWQT
ncbi:hypothetical protein DYB34_008262 [Aphanomyces astaci]|uniref:Uncharacterized protein n=1 Tax=Aphanomyces astaci TaxID=112090 RepID=A0A3R6Z0M1_APHAT|nr:hypothetical protein DYB34_008262 [Aphanomyces astaci]